MLVLHGEALVGDKSVNAGFDTIDGEKKADAATTSKDTGAGFSIINPGFFDTRGWQNVGFGRVPEEEEGDVAFFEIDDDCFAATIEGLVAGKTLSIEVFLEFFGFMFKNKCSTEDPPDDAENGWYR